MQIVNDEVVSRGPDHSAIKHLYEQDPEKWEVFWNRPADRISDWIPCSHPREIDIGWHAFNQFKLVRCKPPGAEHDPNGLDPHAPGAKLDAGKTRVELVLGGFARALMAVAEVGTYGANKYTDDGWVQVADGVNRYRDAAGRHRLFQQMGEEYDPDTNMLHLAHQAWNVLATLELTLREKNNAQRSDS